MIIARNGQIGLCGARKRFVFTNYGGLTNSEDFEQFPDGVITTTVTIKTSQDWEAFPDGALPNNLSYFTWGGRAYTDFENINSGVLAASFDPLSVTAKGATIAGNGKTFRFWVEAYQDFETMTDGITGGTVTPLDGTSVNTNGIIKLYTTNTN